MRLLSALVVMSALAAPASPALSEPANDELARQVREAETAFAKTMADRDLKAFAGFVAEDAIFFGRTSALRGKAAVVEGWKSLYEGAAAPFSWQPETVEVLASGALAHSSGPVIDPQGNQVGTFNSIWRREANGEWRVVFDKGCDVCARKTADVPADKQRVTAVVRFPLPAGTTRADARVMFERSAPTYQKVPGLIRKYYLYAEGPIGGGVYLWEDRQSAERLYTAEWRKAIADRFGAQPEILFFETPVLIDNKTGEVIAN